MGARVGVTVVALAAVASLAVGCGSAQTTAHVSTSPSSGVVTGKTCRDVAAFDRARAAGASHRRMLDLADGAENDALTAEQTTGTSLTQQLFKDSDAVLLLLVHGAVGSANTTALQSAESKLDTDCGL